MGRGPIWGSSSLTPLSSLVATPRNDSFAYERLLLLYKESLSVLSVSKVDYFPHF